MHRAIILLTIFLTAACQEEIVHNLSEMEVNRLRAELHAEGVESDKVRQPDGKWALAVDERQTLESLRFLESRRLLRATSEVRAQPTSLFMSRRERELMQLREVGEGVEDTLARIPGVLEARVHLFREERDAFQRTKDAAPTSASVFLLVSPDRIFAVDEVRDLVSGATGTAHDRVAVLVRYGEISAVDAPSTVPESSVSVPTQERWDWWSTQGVLYQVGAALVFGGVASLWALRPRKVMRSVLTSSLVRS